MYDRWGMTNTEAAALTGVAEADLTDAVMAAAESELVDALGYRPDPDLYTVAGAYVHEDALGFGRAVAWQAAYRTSTPATASDGAVAVQSEGITDYSVTYAGAVVQEPLLAPRAARLLRRWGWLKNAGTTGLTRPRHPDFQTG